jgi:hypothetical protein
LPIAKYFKNNNLTFTSGNIDSLYRIINQIVFKVNEKQCEPTSYQRQIIFEYFPETFPRKVK